MVIANVLPKLQNVKNFVRPFCRKRHWRTRFDSQHVKVSQILAISQWERFYHVLSSFGEKLIWKISPLLSGEIVAIFLNTLTDEGRYVFEDWENLPLTIQMQLSEKWKTFSQFFPFMESKSNFIHLLKKKFFSEPMYFPG